MMLKTRNDLLEKLNNALFPVFHANPWYLTDSKELFDWLKDQDVPTVFMDKNSLLNQPKDRFKNIVLFSATNDNVTYSLLNTLFKNSKLLIVPFFSFDPSFEAIKYTIEKMAASDFTKSSQSNSKILSMLQQRTDPLYFTGEGCKIECVLSDKVHLMQPKESPDLIFGEWEAIGAWFEVAILPDSEDFYQPGFTANGTFLAQGTAIAIHRHAPDSVAEMHREAWALMRNLQDTNEFPLTIIIKDSHMAQVLTQSGRDIASDLLKLTNPKLELLLIEVAMSGNSGLKADEIDWKINSVLNEGAQGIHIAVGDGVTGAHIDFIAPSVNAL